MKRFPLLVSVAAVVVCGVVAACFLLKPANTLSAHDFSSKDQALAIQLSKTGRSWIDFTPDLGYMVLADASGKTRAFESGRLSASAPIWSKTGLFFGGTHSEFVTTDYETTALSRDCTPQGERARYLLDNGERFLVFYAGAKDAQGNKRSVLVGDSHGTESASCEDSYMNVGVCENVLYAVTQTRYASHLLDEARAVYQKQSACSAEEAAAVDNFDVLVELWPENSESCARVLESFPHDEGITHAAKEFVRVGTSIYLLSYAEDNPDASVDNKKDSKAGRAVFEKWDLAAHTRSTLDLVDSLGQAVDINADEVDGQKGAADGATYRFVTRSGKLFSVDMTTGVAQKLYSFSPRATGAGAFRFDVTKRATYALDIADDDNGPCALSRYVFATGAYEDLFEVRGMAPYRKGDVTITGIAVNPSWEEMLGE